MIVITRRFSNIAVIDTETSPCLEAGMGGGGNNIPMIIQVYEEDIDNAERPRRRVHDLEL